MSRPDIEVTLEPTVNNVVRFLRCAPSAEGEPETGLLNLRFQITNTGTTDLRFNKISIFVANAHPNSVLDIPVMLPSERPPLIPGDKLTWTQNTDYTFRIADPSRLYLKIFAFDHDDPLEEIRSIEPHTTPGGAYRFWGKTADLEKNEFWRVHGSEHSNTAVQMFAYDVKVGVKRNDSLTERRSHNDGTLMDGTENDHYRIWGKPIYSIADGTVLHCRNNFPTNPRPLRGDEKFEDAFPDIAEQIDDIGDGNGNFFTITNGTETILYAHMKRGSLNEEFLDAYNSGATLSVQAGDFLGLAGNSGKSTRPHLHIHANKTSPADSSSWSDVARPMNFQSACALKWSKIEANGRTGPWEKLNGRGMPATDCAVWPSNTKPLDLARVGEILMLDKFSQLIPADIYAKLKSPKPPPVEQIWKYLLSIVHKMNRKEKERTLKHLSALGDYVDALKEEIDTSIQTK